MRASKIYTTNANHSTHWGRGSIKTQTSIPFFTNIFKKTIFTKRKENRIRLEKKDLRLFPKILLIHSSMKEENENEGNTELAEVIVPTTSYTSLRDMISLPQSSLNGSWNENIPIKNPLLKQAALAYLQPMSTPPDHDFVNNKCFSCCGGADSASCFQWLNCGTLFRSFVGFVSGTRRRRNTNEDQDIEDKDHVE